MKRLNDTQIKDAEEFLKDYKYVYVCNNCGSIYGTDASELKEKKLCPRCEVNLLRRKKKKEEKNESLWD